MLAECLLLVVGLVFVISQGLVGLVSTFGASGDLFLRRGQHPDERDYNPGKQQRSGACLPVEFLAFIICIINQGPANMGKPITNHSHPSIAIPPIILDMASTASVRTFI